MARTRPTWFSRARAAVVRWKRRTRRIVFGHDIAGGLWRLALVAGTGPVALASFAGLLDWKLLAVLFVSGVVFGWAAFRLFAAPLVNAITDLTVSATSVGADVLSPGPGLSTDDLRVVGARIQEAAAGQRSAQDDLWRRAYFDQLTAIPNRAFLTERLASALAIRASWPHAIAVLILDVDGFKTLNDSRGHAAGDAFLVSFATRLRMLGRRQGVVVGRLGGDEFAIIVDRPDAEEESLNLAESIERLMRRPFTIEGEQILLSASVGIGVSRGGDATMSSLLRSADEALYAVKAAGKASHSLRHAA